MSINRALILIDFQVGFDDRDFWGARNQPDAEQVAGKLLADWRGRMAPVVHIRHISVQPGSPLGPGPGTAFKPEVAPRPDEQIFEKSVNSAFIGTGLEAHLRRLQVTHLVVAGLTTPHCVSTSCRMAANLGFTVTLAHDACAAVATNGDPTWREAAAASVDPQAIHMAAIDHLHGEFVTAAAAADILSGCA